MVQLGRSKIRTDLCRVAFSVSIPYLSGAGAFLHSGQVSRHHSRYSRGHHSGSDKTCFGSTMFYSSNLSGCQETIFSEPLLRAAGLPGPPVEVAARSANNLRASGELRCGFKRTYPLVNIQKNYGNHHLY